MSSELVVHGAELRAAAGRITSASQVAETVHDQGDELVDSARQAGQPDAVRGLGQLFSKWSYGAGLLHQDADQLAVALGQVVDALERLDQRLSLGLIGQLGAPQGPVL